MNLYLKHLDHVADEMESKWGVDRLPHLVGEDLRARFYAQKERLDEAIEAGDHDRLMKAAQGMERAWNTLDTLAMANAQIPAIHKVWETTLPDGRTLAVVKDRRAYKTPKKADLIFTLDEVAKIIGELPELVINAKAKFPGAEITDIRDTIDWKRGDDLPPQMAANGGVA